MTSPTQTQHLQPQSANYSPYPQAVIATPQPAMDKKGRVKKHHGMAITGLVLGIVGAVFGCIPLTFVVAFILGALAIIFGAFGRRWGVGKAGLVLGLIAVVLGIVGAVIVNSTVNDLNKSFSSTSTNKSGVSQGLGSQDASGDVTVGALRLDDLGGHVKVTVTNHSSKRSDYDVELASESADGKTQYDTTDAFIDKLEPGQTASTDADFLSDTPTGALVKVKQVDRLASV